MSAKVFHETSGHHAGYPRVERHQGYWAAQLSFGPTPLRSGRVQRTAQAPRSAIS
jgi:hypothetical protein